MKKLLDDWELAGIVEHTDGRFPCPLYAIPKQGKDKPRYVTDLRPRNAICERDYTTIPNQHIILTDIARANYRSLIDISNAYFQIRVAPECEDFNTINTPFGTYKCHVLLQGDL